MKKLFGIVISFFQYLLNPRPKVFWWLMPDYEEFRIEGKENFGDILTPYIVEKLSGVKPIYFKPSTRGSKYIKHSIMVGSIIDESYENTIVWGSGITSISDRIRGGDFRAVRGPETVKRLIELGFASPQVVGDPSILLPLFYNPTINKKYKIGIIPHYVDYDNISVSLKDKDNILVIDLMTNNIEKVIDQILQCEKIISTSLHGIIVANVYGIPTVWLKYSNKILGDDVKFYDYFHSVELFDISFYNKDILELNVFEDLKFSLPKDSIIKNIQKGLLETYPYKFKRK